MEEVHQRQGKDSLVCFSVTQISLPAVCPTDTHTHTPAYILCSLCDVWGLLKWFVCVEQGSFVFLNHTPVHTKIKAEASLPTSASSYDDIYVQHQDIWIHISARLWIQILC